MQGTYQEHEEYVRDMLGECLGHTWHMKDTCLERARDMLGTCWGHDRNIKGNCNVKD